MVRLPSPHQPQTLTPESRYAVGIISVALLFCIPDLEFRMHHYIAAYVSPLLPFPH